MRQKLFKPCHIFLFISAQKLPLNRKFKKTRNDMDSNSSERAPMRASVIIGILFMAAGLVVFLKNFGFWDIRWHEIFTWQMVLIVVGMFLLCGRDSRKAGWVLIGIGVVFWIAEFVHLSETLRKLVWPVVLMVGGLVLVIGRRRTDGASDVEVIGGAVNDSGETASTNRFNVSSSLSSRSYKPVTSHITGGMVQCTMGSVRLDLSAVELEGNSATIDLSCVFGSCNIIVPALWRVQFNMNTFMGSAVDLRPTPTPPADAPLLVVTGRLVTGSCRVTLL